MTRALPILLLACGPKEEPGTPVVVEPTCSMIEYTQPSFLKSDLLLVLGTNGDRLEQAIESSSALRNSLRNMQAEFRVAAIDAISGDIIANGEGSPFVDASTWTPGTMTDLLDASGVASGSQVHDAALRYLRSDGSFHRDDAELHLLLIHDGQTTNRDPWRASLETLPRDGRLTVSAIVPETDGDVALATDSGGRWSTGADILEDFGELVQRPWIPRQEFELPEDANPDTLQVWVDIDDFTYQGVPRAAMESEDFFGLCSGVCFPYDRQGRTLTVDFVAPGSTVRMCWQTASGDLP